MDIPLLVGIMARRIALRRQTRWSRPEIEQRQARALAALRRHAYEHSPFYRDRHAGLYATPLDRLPTITKAELMASFDTAVCDRRVSRAAVEEYVRSDGTPGLFAGEFRVNATSGSTGLRGIFPFDRREWTWVLASYARAYEWGGVVPNLVRRSRMAVVSTVSPWHQSAQVGSSVASWFVPTLRLDATAPIEELVGALDAWRPQALVGYPSILHRLADEQLAGRLHIDPSTIFAASEVLTDAMRDRIRAAWRTDPYDIYGATETAAIAAECSEHRMHLFEDLVITEVVDESNRPVPVGEPGAKVLVTVLFGRTLPLIRYELSDRIVLSQRPCACGRAFHTIERIEGRTEDVLMLVADDGRSIDVHPNIFHDALDAEPVEGWQVVETRDGIDVTIVDSLQRVKLDAVVENVRAALARIGLGAAIVRGRRVDAIERGATGKAPLVRRFQ